MSFLSATGIYLPAQIVTSKELAQRLSVPAQWIANVSGILERRVAGEDETVVSMGVRAAQDCLQNAGLHASELGAVLVSSGSHIRAFPGPAAEITAALGLRGTFALDVPVASAGSIFALALADTLARQYGNVLVISSEKMTSYAYRAPLNRGIALLFGDGAGACLVRRDQGIASIEATVLHSDGAYVDDLWLNSSGEIQMRGRSVIVHSTEKVPGSIREVLDKTSTAIEDVAIFLMHQANLHLMHRVAKVLGVAESRFFTNIEHYGNTSSASLLIALHEWSRQKGFSRGVPVVLAGFGAGYHWGSALLRGC